MLSIDTIRVRTEVDGLELLMKKGARKHEFELGFLYQGEEVYGVDICVYSSGDDGDKLWAVLHKKDEPGQNFFDRVIERVRTSMRKGPVSESAFLRGTKFRAT